MKGVLVATKKKEDSGNEGVRSVTLIRLKRETAIVPIVGTSPLVVHAWSKKAREDVVGPHVGNARPRKELRDPQAEYLDSLYHLDGDRTGFPASGIKAAIVTAARLFDGISMTTLKPAIHVSGEGPQQLIPIEGEHRLREDLVRIGGKGQGTGTATTRWRGEYVEWKMLVEVTYLSALLDLNSLVNLVDGAGVGGIGEWRPEKSPTGSLGTFKVDDTRDVVALG